MKPILRPADFDTFDEYLDAVRDKIREGLLAEGKSEDEANAGSASSKNWG